MQTETEWVLRYRSPNLWNPLRSSGQDTLIWATATLDERHLPAVNELTMKFVFPAAWTNERIVEQSNLGAMRTERLGTGQTVVTWRQENPAAGVYQWTVHGMPQA